MINLCISGDKSNLFVPFSPASVVGVIQGAPASAGAPLGNNRKTQAVLSGEPESGAVQGDDGQPLVGPAQESIRLRYRLLAQHKRLLRGELRPGHALYGCQTVSIASYVQIMRALAMGERAGVSLGGLVRCNSVWCCPVCSARIAAGRAAEIRQAIHGAKHEGLDVYMLTLTLRHGAGDDLRALLVRMSEALTSFWGHWSVKRVLSDWGRVGHIRATEATYGAGAGWHPHFHVLLFGPRGLDVSGVGREWAGYWVDALRRRGLDGTTERALRLEGASAVKNYLTKMSAELALGNVTKSARLEGHYSPFQVLGMSHYEDRYKTLWRAYYWATKGRNALAWSRGLKARYGVGEIPDSELSEIEGDYMIFASAAGRDWRNLTHEDIAGVRLAAARGDAVELGDILDARGVQYWLGGVPADIAGAGCRPGRAEPSPSAHRRDAPQSPPERSRRREGRSVADGRPNTDNLHFDLIEE